MCVCVCVFVCVCVCSCVWFGEGVGGCAHAHNCAQIYSHVRCLAVEYVHIGACAHARVCVCSRAPICMWLCVYCVLVVQNGRD